MSKNTKIQVAVLGAGNMGTAVAQVVAGNGFKVKLWNHAGDLEPLEQIHKFRENRKYLSGVKLSSNIIPESDMGQAVSKTDVVFFVVPSFCVSAVAKQSAQFLKP